MEQAISRGSLHRLFEGGCDEMPIVQCVQIKAMERKDDSTPDRYRMVVSDVQNFIQTMLATQANWVVTNGQLKRGCAVRLKSYNPTVVRGKRILIITDLEVLTEYGELEKIGAPVALETMMGEDGGEPQPASIASNNFYGNKPNPPPKQENKPLPSHTNNTANSNLYRIEALSPYARKWTIKARCTFKSPVKTWHNTKGEGKLFSVHLLDESGEIKAAGFNAECDAFYELFQEGGVYYISSPCRVQLAKKQFSNLTNDYELTFERDTLVEKAEDQDSSVPQMRYNFTNIGALQSIDKDSTIDTIAILKDIGEVSDITAKSTGKPYSKRELTLVDDTMNSVRLTIWGQTATSFDAPLESVLAFKGLKVSDFGGRSLSLLSSGSVSVDPDIDEAHRLKGWYDANGRSDGFTAQSAAGGSMSGRNDAFKTIGDVRDENIGMGDTAEYFSLKATVVYLKNENISYPACPGEGCNKKVVEIETDQWRCEKCDKTWEKPRHRFIFSFNVNDETGTLWLSLFDEVGQILLGTTADNAIEMKANGDDRAFLQMLEQSNFKSYIFKVRAKMETYQDQQKVRYNAIAATPINFSAECNRVMAILKEYNTDSDSLFVQG